MKTRLLILAVLAIATFLGVRSFVGPSQTASAESIVEVTVPELTGMAKVGEEAFNANCSSCHGTNAAGLDGKGPPLIHKIYEPGHHGDMAFVLAAKNGVRAHHWRFGNMPPVEDVEDEDIQNIITYVRTLQRANGIN